MRIGRECAAAAAVAAAAAAMVGAWWAAGGTVHRCYFDACFYLLGGEAVAAGETPRAPVVWNWLEPPAGLRSGFDYWAPGQAYLLGAALRLLGRAGPDLLQAALLLALAGLAWTAARRLGAGPAGVALAACLAAAGGPYAAVLRSADAAAAYAAAGAAVLLARRAGPAAAAGAAAVALRYDGVLPALARAARGDGPGLWALAAALVAFGLLKGPWSPFGGGPALLAAFLADYAEMFEPGAAAQRAGRGLQGLLEAGTPWERAAAALSGLAYLWNPQGAALVVPAAFGLAAARRTDGPLREAAVLGAGLALEALVFPHPAAHGTLLHASAALWPTVAALAGLGLERLGRLARPPAVGRALGPAFALLLAAGCLRAALLEQIPLDREARAARTAAACLAAVGEAGPVMAWDPPLFARAAGRPAAAPVLGDPELAAETAARYGIRAAVWPEQPPQTLAGRADPPAGFEEVCRADGYVVMVRRGPGSR